MHPKKTRRAKTRRRRLYQGCLERKIKAQGETITVLQMEAQQLQSMYDDMRTAYHLMQEAMDNFLKKRLASKVMDDKRGGDAYRASFTWNEQAWTFFDNPKPSSYNPDIRPDATADVLRRYINLPAGELHYEELINKLHLARHHSPAEYLKRVSHLIGQRLSHAILDKLLTDIITINNGRLGGFKL